MRPTLGVVTGTYQRLVSLKRMVDSARYAIPRGISYQFTIVDGGSTDGTIEWCRQQPDMKLIEHGELRGAIKAFCDGARATDADYILLSNDDISFDPLGIIAAISHLERTPSCGAVAFKDNRTSLVTGDGTQYRVEGIGATTASGEKVMVVYPQVGLIRKELGEAVGWWGDRDEIMQNARTYGGDSFLGASIWQAGYTVDAVDQSIVEDHIERDELRTINNVKASLDSTAYYKKFPTVQLPAELKSYQLKDRLRILSLPVYEWNFPGKRNLEVGLTEALAEYGLAFEWDYLNEPTDLIELVKAWQPDLLITQIQGPGRITPYIMASMRNAAPGMTIVNFNGDAHEYGLTSPGMLDLLRYTDLQTVVNAKVLPEYERFGVRAAYWQIGYKDPVSLPDMPHYEVLWQGNCYDDRRTKLIHLLRAMRLPASQRPIRLGVYGNCEKGDGNTHYNFAAQRALYQNATINIGDTFPDTVGFVSNRLFQCLAAGGFLLQQHSEGLEAFTGLVPGIHYAEWMTPTDLIEKILYWLDDARAGDRQRIAAAGKDYVRANFSYPAQVRKLFTDLLPLIAEGERASV